MNDEDETSRCRLAICLGPIFSRKTGSGGAGCPARSAQRPHVIYTISAGWGVWWWRWWTPYAVGRFRWLRCPRRTEGSTQSVHGRANSLFARIPAFQPFYSPGDSGVVCEEADSEHGDPEESIRVRDTADTGTSEEGPEHGEEVAGWYSGWLCLGFEAGPEEPAGAVRDRQVMSVGKVGHLLPQVGRYLCRQRFHTVYVRILGISNLRDTVVKHKWGRGKRESRN